MRKKKIKKPEISKKASRYVVKMLYLVKRETGQWNIRETSRRLEVNQKYISENIRFGIEPSNLELREKMGIKNKECPACHHKLITHKKVSIKKERPEFMKVWSYLPVEERQKVIKEYLKWKDKNK
jgi:hypothetical protein